MKTILLISPARCLSTAIFRNLLNQEVFQYYALHPKHHERKVYPRDLDIGLIKAIIKKKLAKEPQGEHQDAGLTLVKEMARNILSQDWKEIQENEDIQPIIIVRNPLLAVESLMRLNLSFFVGDHEETWSVYSRVMPKRQSNFVERSEYQKTRDSALRERSYECLFPLLNIYQHYDDSNAFRGEYVKQSLRAVHNLAIDDVDDSHQVDWNAIPRNKWPEFVKWSRYFNAKEIGDKLISYAAKTSVTGWTRLFSTLQSTINPIVLEASLFAMQPKQAMANLCLTLGLELPKMNSLSDSLFELPKGSVDHFSAHYSSAMLQRRDDANIAFEARKPLSLNKFPSFLRHHLAETALPCYVRLLRDQPSLLPYDEKCVGDSQSFEASDVAIDPVTQYAVTSATLHLSDASKQARLLTIRAHAPDFSDVYDIIDSNV